METIVIYISYNQYEYTNYFHFIKNDIIEDMYIAIEEVDKRFASLMNNINVGKSFNLCIIQGADASEWDFKNSLEECGVELGKSGDMDLGYIQKVVNKLFDGFDNNSDAKRKDFKILFSGTCVYRRDLDGIGESNNQTRETLGQAEEILKHSGEEKTELARIIEEKYKNMRG